MKFKTAFTSITCMEFLPLILSIAPYVASFAPPQSKELQGRSILLDSKFCFINNNFIPQSQLQRISVSFNKYLYNEKLPLFLSNSNDSHDNTPKEHEHESGFANLEVAGASVSPLGFLVVMKSTIVTTETSSTTTDERAKEGRVEMDIAFPIQLTCASSTNINTNKSTISSSSEKQPNTNKNAVDKTSNKNMNRTIPALFQENYDQTSVTTPEALTFLQLVNGVDMATPIFPPDSLSLLAVIYSFLLLDANKGHDVLDSVNARMESGGLEGGDENEGVVLEVEDELGLLSKTELDSATSNNVGEKDADVSSAPALEYIRSMVRTTLPEGVAYLEASPWQRAKVQLPRVWLHGVRLEEVDLSISSDEGDCGDNGDDGDNSASGNIATVPIRYILECSVDDGSKRLDIPLYAIPKSYEVMAQERENSIWTQQQVEVSNELLQELSHSYHVETSAAFTSMALYHRYKKSSSLSNAGVTGGNNTNNNKPTLRVSKTLLEKLFINADSNFERFCWTSPHFSNNIDAMILDTDLPMYRPLSQLQEEDQRVLSFLKQQNFGRGSSTSDPSENGNTTSKTDNGNIGNDNDSSSNDKNSNSNNDVAKAKKSLTLEQQAKQQQLKAAWKIAMQRGDEGALEKIQKAMEEMEEEVMKMVQKEEMKSGTSSDSLDMIQRAMRESGVGDSGNERKGGKEEDEEDVVGLISDLEEATNARFAQENEKDEE